MKKLLVLLFSFLFTIGILASEWVPITSDKPQKPTIDVVSDNGSEIVFKVSIPGYFTEQLDIDGELYTFCKLDEGANLMERGCPSLPFLVASLMINDQGEVTVTTENEKPFASKVERYMPSKGHFTRNIDPNTVPYTFSKVYDTNAFYPGETAEAGEPYILRNTRGANIQIRPFQYNPAQGELIVYSSMTVKVKIGRSGGANILTDEMKVPESIDFENIYMNKFLNFGVNQSRYTPVGEVGNMLIITYDDFYDEMLPFYYWKQQKGIPVEMVTLTTAGSTAANVKTYITNYYNTNGLTFVLLVGDSGQFPVLDGTAGNVSGNASDPSYVLISGSDSYPEAFVSRFPAATSTHVQTMVNRVINYEKTPSSSATWYHEATGIAGDDSGGDPVMYDWERVDLLKDKLKSPAYNYTPFDEIYHSPSSSDTANAINEGSGLVLYINHGDITYWPVSSFYTTNVYALTNTNKVPLIIDVACVNGQFDYSSDCFGESWQKAGTPAAPTGALAIYASSTNQSWVPPCDGQTGSVDLIVAESYHSVGGILVNGCMYGMDLWPGTEAEQLYQQWHIFGDASAMFFSDTPTAMTVTHSGAFPVGQTTYNVTVTGVEGALCALYDATNHVTYGHAYTNSSGAATITLDPVPSAPVSLTLTVTAFNRMPNMSPVEVIVPDGPFLNYVSHAVVTEVVGNGDGVVNPGETIRMSVTLTNIGVDPATGVTGTLSTTSGDISITDNSASYPDIPASGSGTSVSPHYTFTVGSGVANGYQIPFSVEWSATGGYSDDTSFSVPVCALLTITGVGSDDVTGSSATVNWTTSVASTSTVYYGTTMPPTTELTNAALTTSHSMAISGLTECTSYYYYVQSSSAGCYTTTANNGGSYYTFSTGMNVTPTYDSTDVPVTINGSEVHTSTIAVPDDKEILDVNVTITNLTHVYDADVEMSLIGPDATTVNLSDDNGSSGDNYIMTVFDDEAATSITTGTAPFTGSFIPEGSLASFDGKNASGTWTLRIIDNYPSVDDGTLNGWSITFTYPAQSCGASLEYQSNTYTEECNGTGTGGGNSYIDPGEDVTLQLTLHNNGTSTVTGVTGTLSTLTSGVTVTDSTASFPNIAADATGTSLSDHFGFQVDSGVACGTVIDFNIHMVSNEGNWDDTFTMVVGHQVAGSNVALWSESYDSTTFPPTGWAKLDVSGTPGDWLRSTATHYPSGGPTHSGAGLAYFNSFTCASGSTTRLYRSGSTLIPSGVPSASVVLWMYHDTGYPTYTTEGIDVQISTNGTTWTTVGTRIARYDGSTGWKQHTVNVSSYIGQSVYVGILGVSQYGNDCHIDDVSLNYEQAASCTVEVCSGGCSNPTQPTIGSVTDDDACAQDGVTITFTAGTPSTSNALVVDTVEVATGITSPYPYNPGNTASHSYVMRTYNTSSCHTDSTSTAASDANGTPSAPSITGIVDLDPNNLTGIQVSYTAGSPATQHDLYRNGGLAVSNYVSGSTYLPGDNTNYTYTVSAVNGSCYTVSPGVSGTDAYTVTVPPEVAVGASYTWTANQTAQTMNWTAEPTATGYNVYRGLKANLAALLDGTNDFCTRVDNNAATGLEITADDPQVQAGRCYYYLITGESTGGEGPAGNATAGPRMVNTTGVCP